MNPNNQLMEDEDAFFKSIPNMLIAGAIVWLFIAIFLKMGAHWFSWMEYLSWGCIAASGIMVFTWFAFFAVPVSWNWLKSAPKLLFDWICKLVEL